MMEGSILQQAMWGLINKEAFLGNFLQELTVCMITDFPTAAITYNKKTMEFKVIVGKQFFERLTPAQRVAILRHELMHFSSGHLFRWEFLEDDKENKLNNIAADMAINQYIDDLPEGCVNVEHYKMKDGSPFPKFRTMEVYYDLLKQTSNKPQEGKDPGESINYEIVSKYMPMDAHDWEALSEEEKQNMLQEAKKLVRRTIDKVYRDFSKAGKGAKDLLDDIEARIKALNYKGLLKFAIRRSLSANDRASSYLRPNKRYGVLAPGSIQEKLPSLAMYMDMSGSISITEANQFLNCVNGFLGVGDYRKCMLGFWHTELYQFRKYKAKTHLKEEDMQSGGTDPMCVLKHIKETDPNLAIILTDGYYDKEEIKLHNKIIWVISEGGNENHPYKDMGLTITLKRLK